jgi:hypothetical protein
MRIELLPIVLGVIVALVGMALLYDAVGNPDSGPMRERRRRIRASINRFGEGLVGTGTFLLGGALIGRDAWRFGTLTVLVGTVLLIWGAGLNWRYLREILLFRGAARRGESTEVEQPFDDKPRLRIR